MENKHKTQFLVLFPRHEGRELSILSDERKGELMGLLGWSRTNDRPESAKQELHNINEIFFEETTTTAAMVRKLSLCSERGLPSWGIYDVINPFGDSRSQEQDIIRMWVVDLNADTLTLINRDIRSHFPLEMLRTHRHVEIRDMLLLGESVPPPQSLQVDLHIPHWTPQMSIDPRHRAFLHRIFRDFDHQWRHVLRNTFNVQTLSNFSLAIIELATLSFNVSSSRLWHSTAATRDPVKITQLPAWTLITETIFYTGEVYVIALPDIRDGIAKANELAPSSRFGPSYTSNNPHCVILSVKHVALCRFAGPEKLEYTRPEPLFNGNHGTGRPSDLALDYLVWALAPRIPPVVTRLSRLPTELQDKVLSCMCDNPVLAAANGCRLGLGTTFSWKDGRHDIRLVESYRAVPQSDIRLGMQIQLTSGFSGVVYMGGRYC